MKILVTGNSGYIGNHLVSMLKMANHEVYGQDIQSSLVDVDKFLLEDIRTKTFENEIFDCVVHLAALVKVSESETDPTKYYTTNINGTINILEKVKTKNFIFASTGVAKNCNNPYGVSKKAAEDIVTEYCQKNSMAYTIFRFYNVIGKTVAPATNPDGLFFNLMRAQSTKVFNLYGSDYKTRDGSALRDYVHVVEICHAIIEAMTNPANGIENLGHGEGYTVKEIVDTFKRVNNTDFEVIKFPRRRGDLESSVLDNPSRYMPKLYSIEEMLKVK